jgi:transcriptional regulator, arsR family
MFNDMFKAFSDPIRREILLLLKNKSMSAGEIAENFEITSATISYHLSLLKKSELIRERKVKNFIYYDLNMSVFEELILWFNSFKGGYNEKE